MQTQRNAKGSPIRATTTTAASGEPEDMNLAPTKVDSFAKGSPTRGAVERSETERLDEGQPDRKPLLDSTSPSRLTPCHLPYRGEALAFRKASPLRQRLPY